MIYTSNSKLILCNNNLEIKYVIITTNNYSTWLASWLVSRQNSGSVVPRYSCILLVSI